jgi:hypothetical protein
MPFGQTGAYWALLGPGVQLRRTEYELGPAVSRINASGYPGAIDFSLTSVLFPPSEAKALAALSPIDQGNAYHDVIRMGRHDFSDEH